jgi:glycerol-3-phosphate dehydrogenase
MIPDYDLVVIGAGIHGAGVAQAAAARGHRTLVLEQTAPAAGTSSRSSKLIHGGLRYLESLQFGLVREALAERELLLRLAPALVRRVPFFIPVYRATRRRPWQVRAGLSLYTLLAGLRGRSGFRALPRGEWGTLDGLETNGLEAVFRYADAQTDDAALTRAVLASARALGAEFICPASFAAAQRADDGYEVTFRTGTTEQRCRTRTLVNAAGPWVNEVLARITPAPPVTPVELVQGTHIVVGGRITRGIYYGEAPRDGRAVFVMPWRENILVGTTEHGYRGDPAAVRPLPEEIAYLRETLSHYFPAQAGEVREAFAGLRVLPGGKTATATSLSRGPRLDSGMESRAMPQGCGDYGFDPIGAGRHFHRPRETVLATDRARGPRLVTVYGGKLTTYRRAALKVMARLAPSLPKRRAVADTAQLRLTDGEP